MKKVKNVLCVSINDNFWGEYYGFVINVNENNIDVISPVSAKLVKFDRKGNLLNSDSGENIFISEKNIEKLNKYVRDNGQNNNWDSRVKIINSDGFYRVNPKEYFIHHSIKIIKL